MNFIRNLEDQHLNLFEWNSLEIRKTHCFHRVESGRAQNLTGPAAWTQNRGARLGLLAGGDFR
jgi:hypothetical protein